MMLAMCIATSLFAYIFEVLLRRGRLAQQSI
jgi:hypothetical protein